MDHFWWMFTKVSEILSSTFFIKAKMRWLPEHLEGSVGIHFTIFPELGQIFWQVSGHTELKFFDRLRKSNLNADVFFCFCFFVFVCIGCCRWLMILSLEKLLSKSRFFIGEKKHLGECRLSDCHLSEWHSCVYHLKMIELVGGNRTTPPPSIGCWLFTPHWGVRTPCLVCGLCL